MVQQEAVVDRTRVEPQREEKWQVWICFEDSGDRICRWTRYGCESKSSVE